MLGSNFLRIHDFGRSVDVSGCETSAGSFELPTISGDIEYDHPIIFQVGILVYHQVIH